MATRGRPRAELELSDEERATLQRWSRRAKPAQALTLRCRIVLACAEGLSNVEVAGRLSVSRMTVGKWRSRFLQQRLDGLLDEDRPGRPPSVTMEQVEDVIVATLEQTPRNATHWSRASMAQRSGLSKSTIGRIWRDFGLKPHRAETFKLSTDPPPCSRPFARSLRSLDSEPKTTEDILDSLTRYCQRISGAGH